MQQQQQQQQQFQQAQPLLDNHAAAGGASDASSDPEIMRPEHRSFVLGKLLLARGQYEGAARHFEHASVVSQVPSVLISPSRNRK